MLRWILPFILISSLNASSLSVNQRKTVAITNIEGITINAEVLSVVRSSKDSSWLCFRKPDGKDLFLYPFSQISKESLLLLSETFAGNGLLVADGLTGPQLDVLAEYLAADPRERLLIELRQARKTERLLAREWKRLQDQTWKLQQQLAAVTDPNFRPTAIRAFQNSLRARDRVGKKLVLLQAEIRRMEERIELLQRIGVPIEDDIFADQDSFDEK